MKFQYEGAIRTSDLIETLPAAGCITGVSCRVATDGRVAMVKLGTQTAGFSSAGLDTLIAELVATRAAMQPAALPSPTRHTCNPDERGRPLPFGRRAPLGVCPRCDELTAGADPRLGWRRPAELPMTDADRAAHRAACTACRTGGVCTAFDW